MIHDFCREFKRRGIGISWSCNARADLDYSTMKAMKDAGCRLLVVGYESGSESILKNIDKGISKKQMEAFNCDAKKVNLLIHGDFVFGLPGETHESAKLTIDFIKFLKPNMIQVAVATPIPGTKFFEYAKNNGYLLTDDLIESIDENGFQKCIISYPNFSKNDIEIFMKKALRGYYLSPTFMPIILKNIARKNGFYELKSILKSAKFFLKYSWS